MFRAFLSRFRNRPRCKEPRKPAENPCHWAESLPKEIRDEYRELERTISRKRSRINLAPEEVLFYKKIGRAINYDPKKAVEIAVDCTLKSSASIPPEHREKMRVQATDLTKNKLDVVLGRGSREDSLEFDYLIMELGNGKISSLLFRPILREIYRTLTTKE